MEKLEFRPTRILLVFRLIGVALVCLPIGGIVTAVCVETNISVSKAFSLGSLIPLVCLATYTTLFFFTIRYDLDDRYISRSSGVLWKQRRSIPLEKITNLDVRQGPFERIFGYGKIWVFTPSTGAATPEEKLAGITKPHDMKQVMIERSEAAKHAQPITTQDKSVEPSGEVVSLLSEIRDSLKNIETSLSKQGKEA
jgi:uncharacterized membrane protein YdbT with pleckstrin-like domain